MCVDRRGGMCVGWRMRWDVCWVEDNVGGV